MAERNEQIADDGVKLLISQYRGKENIERFVRAMLAPIQAHHNEIWDAIDSLQSLDALNGWLMDIVGSWVGCKRQGWNDTEYLRQIKIQIAVNTSSGTVDQVESAVNLITGSTYSQSRDLTPYAISIYCNANLSKQQSTPEVPFTYGGSAGTGYGQGAYASSVDYDASLYIPILKKIVMGGVRIVDLVYLESNYIRFRYGGSSGSGYGEGAYATSAI